LYRPSEEEWVTTALELRRWIKRCPPEAWAEAGDAAQDAVLKFLESDHGLGYNPAIAPLHRFLCGIAKFLMKEQRKTGIRRAENNSQIESQKTGSVDPQSQYAAEIFIDQLKKAITSNDAASGLSPIISAMEECHDEANVNQSIANARNVSVESVVNDKKRLRRFGKALRTVPKQEPPG
jgi:DNA-directed RNA polymerase specialized sigma24 family protein